MALPRFAFLLIAGALMLALSLQVYAALPATVPYPFGRATLMSSKKLDPTVAGGGCSGSDCPDPSLANTCDTILIDQCAGGAMDARTATIAVGEPTNTTATGWKGTIVYLSGSGGVTYWSDYGGAAPGHINTMRALGYRTVQIKYNGSWMQAPIGNAIGVKHAACLPATAIKYAYDHYYANRQSETADGTLPGSPGHCGFCVTGNSGGSTQTAFAMSHYGGKSFIHRAVPTSGPVHAGIAYGCQKNTAVGYAGRPAAAWIDSSLGFNYGDTSPDRTAWDLALPPTVPGPCWNQTTDPYWTRKLLDTAVDSYVDGEFNYGSVPVNLIFGSKDPIAPPLGVFYYDRVVNNKGVISADTIPNAPHGIPTNADGVTRLEQLLTM
jgi:hypothetical protein